MAGASTIHIPAQLVSWGNPEGEVNNSDLELGGSVIHHTCMANFCDVRKRNMLSHTDNTAGLWWQSKGLSTSISYPLHLQAILQRLHCYVPHHEFWSRVKNSIFDLPSCSRYITYTALLAHIDSLHPQDMKWRLCNPPSDLVSAIASALCQTTSPRYSLMVELPPPKGT